MCTASIATRGHMRMPQLRVAANSQVWSGSRRHYFFRVGVDPVADMPVFDGRKVLDGSLEVELDKVLDHHGVCVLGAYHFTTCSAACRNLVM